MNVGDYVRTNYGSIVKIEAIDEEVTLSDKGYIDKENIIKSSPNIIDLIEVGDYVNGFRVNDSSYGLIIIAPTTDIWEMNSTKDEFKNNNLFVEKIYKLEDIEIKSVITKEQFESMEYKVGE